MKYQPPFSDGWPNVANPDAGYVNGNPPEGIKGSIPPASSIEYPMREVVHTIEKGGIVPSDADLYQLTRGVRRALYAYAVDTGSANSLSIALDPPLMEYSSGLEVRVLVSNDNTAAATIRVNGLSTQQIVKKDSSTLIAGDIRRGGIAVLVHDGTNFQLVSGASGSTTITGAPPTGVADYIVDNGTPNALSGSPSLAPTSLAAGQSFLVLVNNANIDTLTGVWVDGACTLNVNNLGAKAIVLPSGLPLVAGDIVKNMLIRVSYDGSKFFLLSPLHMQIIDQPTAYIVGPQVGADFADLNKAMRWLTRRRIDKTGLVTFNLQGSSSGAPLVHTYTTEISIDHPDGNRINIAGAGMNGLPTTLVATGAGVSTIQANAATNLTHLRTKFRTEIHFNGGPDVAGGDRYGFVCRGKLNLLKEVLITGPGMSGTNIGGWLIVNDLLNCNTVAVCNTPKHCVTTAPNATLNATNFYIIGAGISGAPLQTACCINLSYSSNLELKGTVWIANSMRDGIAGVHGCIVVVGNGAKIWGHLHCGLLNYGCSSAHAQSIDYRYCAFAACFTQSANSWHYYSTATNCGRGFYCSQNANMDCSSTYTTGCYVGPDYIAEHGSYMYAASFQNGSAQFSPARNTEGNSNSMIEG